MPSTAFAATIAAATLVLALASAETKKPNVLFIIADDLSTRLGFMGHNYVLTPHMDAFAKSGVVFNNAHTAFTICSPSRGSLFTGRRPDNIALNDFSAPEHAHYSLRNGSAVKSMMEHFRDNGYKVHGTGKLYQHHTSHLTTDWDTYTELSHDCQDSSIPWLSDNFQRLAALYKEPTTRRLLTGSQIDKVERMLNTAQSAQPSQSVQCMAARRQCPNEKFLNRNTGDWCAVKDDELKKGLPTPLHDDAVATIIDDVIQNGKNDDKPWMAVAGFYRPHLDFVAPQSFFNLYPDNIWSMPRPTSQHFPKHSPKLHFYENQSPIPTRFDTKTRTTGAVMDYRKAYYAAVSYVDSKIGQVLRKLEETGQADNTIVVLTSDHGFSLGEQSMFKKGSLFQWSTHVPLVIRAPWLTKAAGKRSDAFVSSIDIYRTLSELADLDDIEATVDGRSMAPLMEGLHTSNCGELDKDVDAIEADPTNWRYSFSQISRFCEHPETYGKCLPCINCDRIDYMGYTVTSGQYRLVRWYKWDNECQQAGQVVETEFYDFQSRSPSLGYTQRESQNRAGWNRYRAIEAEMTEVLDAYVHSTSECLSQ